MDKNDYFYETCYETWRNGGNPDHVDYDKCVDDFYDNMPPEYSPQKMISLDISPEMIRIQDRINNTNNEIFKIMGIPKEMFGKSKSIKKHNFGLLKRIVTFFKH